MRSWGQPQKKEEPPHMPEPIHGAWIILYAIIVVILGLTLLA